MTRTSAREVAVQLCFAASANKIDPAQMLDDFFSDEHYGSLSSEQELFSDYPDKKQILHHSHMHH